MLRSGPPSFALLPLPSVHIFLCGGIDTTTTILYCFLLHLFFAIHVFFYGTLVVMLYVSCMCAHFLDIIAGRHIYLFTYSLSSSTMPTHRPGCYPTKYICTHVHTQKTRPKEAKTGLSTVHNFLLPFPFHSSNNRWRIRYTQICVWVFRRMTDATVARFFFSRFENNLFSL